jgi:MoaE-MoaD fusion protein
VRVQVLYFAVLRDRLGLAEEAVDLPTGSTASDALAALCERQPALLPFRGRVQLAVNRKIVPGAHPLAEGDELALIPPVAGGSGPRRIHVGDAPLSLDEVTAAVTGSDAGGVVTFTGQVRDHGQLAKVVRLEYEAYVPMAEEVLAAIADEIQIESPGVRVAIHHRVGVLFLGEPAVMIAAAAPHRAEAFAACRVAIERLKQRAPIWKKEIGEGGEVWIGSGP